MALSEIYFEIFGFYGSPSQKGFLTPALTECCVFGGLIPEGVSPWCEMMSLLVSSPRLQLGRNPSSLGQPSQRYFQRPVMLFAIFQCLSEGDRWMFATRQHKGTTVQLQGWRGLLPHAAQ